jgi:hypothetical protein
MYEVDTPFAALFLDVDALVGDGVSFFMGLLSGGHPHNGKAAVIFHIYHLK